MPSPPETKPVNHTELPGIDDCRVGYVLKRYPRLSETFIVSELPALPPADAAHEAAL